MASNMAKVTYLDGRTSQYGYEFTAGVATEVTDEKHLAKFRGNAAFEVTEAKVTPPKPAVDGLHAKHNGGGRYIIVRGDETVSTGLSKDDAAAFNALTDDEKAAYVAGSNS